MPRHGGSRSFCRLLISLLPDAFLADAQQIYEAHRGTRLISVHTAQGAQCIEASLAQAAGLGGLL